jgi:hypothetical protein
MKDKQGQGEQGEGVGLMQGAQAHRDAAAAEQRGGDAEQHLHHQE